ncbi:unnamed protein product [Sphagnum jensenii]|uniref:Cold-regulated protein n=1 Tax=Sphagnum jensenii TaxID=128206 RepID=A0ABP1BCE6_9BRYO
MAIVKVEKATANKVDEAKNLAEQMAVVKGIDGKGFFQGGSLQGPTRTIAQVVKQLGSTFDSSKSNEEEEGNLKGFNITKKPIGASKQMEEPIRAQEANPSSEKGPKGKAATYG